MKNAQKKRRERKVTRLLQTESRWLQKVLFDLKKAEEARRKLADARKEPPPPIFNGRTGEASMQSVRESLSARVADLMDTIQNRNRVMR